MKSSSGGIVGPAPSRLQETGLHCSRGKPRAESDVVFFPLFASSAVFTPLVLAKQNNEKHTNLVNHQNVLASFLPVWSTSTARDGLPSFPVNTTLNLGPEMSTEHQSIYTPRVALSSTHNEQNRKLMDSTTPSFFTDPSSLSDLKGQSPGPLRSEDSCRVVNAFYSPASFFTLPMLPSSQKNFIQQQPTNFHHSYFSSTQNLPLSRLLSGANKSESCNVLSHFSPVIPQPTAAIVSFAESLFFSLQINDTTSNCCFPPLLQEQGVAVEKTVNISPKKRKEWSQSRWRSKSPNVKGETTHRREKAGFSTSFSSGVTSETDALVPQKKNSSFYVVDMLPKDNRRPLSTTGACRKTIATSGGSKDGHCRSVAEMVACHLVLSSESHTADDYLLESSPTESTFSLSPPCTLLSSDFATSTKITATHSDSYSSYSSSSPIMRPPPPSVSEMNGSENSCSATSHCMICIGGTSHSEERERKASRSPLERCGSTSNFGTSKKVATKSSCSSTCDRPFVLSIQNDNENSQHIPRLFSQPFRPPPPLRAIPLPFSSLSCSISEPRAKPPHAAAAISDREGTFYKNPIGSSDTHFVETENSSLKPLESTREADVVLNVSDCESNISRSPHAHSSTTPTKNQHSSLIPKNFTLEQRHRAHQEVRWDEPHLHYPRVKLPDKDLNLGFTEELRRRLEQRRKQIAYGKSTCGYRHYRLVIEKIGDREFHNPMHPVTPRPDFNSSKRTFDKVLNTWRRQLHKWDEWHAKAHKKRQETSGKGWENAKNEANKSSESYSPIKRRLTSHTEEEAIVHEVCLEHKRIKGKSAQKNCSTTPLPYQQEGSESTSSSRSHSCSSLGSSSSAFTSEGQQVFGLLHTATLKELGLCISPDEANNPPPLSQSTPHLLSPSTTLLPDTPFTTVTLHDAPCSSSPLMGRECGSPLHSLANDGRAANGSPSSSVASTRLLNGVSNRSFRGTSESCSHPSTAVPFIPHTIISIAEDASSDVRLPSESAWCANSHKARKGSLSTVKNTERGDGKSTIDDRHKKVEEHNMKAVSFLPDLHRNESEEQMELTLSPIVGTGWSEWCRNNSFASAVPMSRPTSTTSLFSPPSWPSNTHELIGIPTLDSSRNTASEQFMLLDEGFYDGWSEASLTILNPNSQMDSGANRSARSIPSPSGSNQSHAHPYYSMYTSAASTGLRRTSSFSSTFLGLLSPYSFLVSPQDGGAPSSRNR